MTNNIRQLMTLIALAGALKIVEITVVDALYSRVEPQSSRRHLVKGSKATAMSGLVLLGPAIAVGGIARGINNSAVNAEIEQRQATLPLDAKPGQDMSLNLFFPLAPSPVMVELVYTDNSGKRHEVVIDTRTALHGLHIDEADQQT